MQRQVGKSPLKLIKQNLRNRLREKRLHLPESLQHHFSTIISRRLMQTAVFRSARTIALYAHSFGEVSTALIFQASISHHKACYFPVLFEKRLIFVQVNHHTPWQANRFGILEPFLDEKKVIEPSSLDLVILPLVAFDTQGHRLGMGGGFYDRTFSFKKRQSHQPKLVGLSYDFQKVDHVPRSNLDILLDFVVTDKHCYVI